jgi:hypothetical protein
MAAAPYTRSHAEAFTQPLGGSFDRVLRVWILSCISQLCDAWNVGEFGLKRLPR